MSRNRSGKSRGDTNRPLLARILDTPHLARAVPRLPPQVLHRIIEQQGLEASVELISLTTPGQVAGLFDIDLWRSPTPGAGEQFDRARFGEWLEVLADADPALAASRLAELDAGLIAVALAQHIFVFDPATLYTVDDIDGDFVPIRRAVEAEYRAEIGGYLIVGKRRDAWDALTSVLLQLEAEHRTTFDRLMTACRAMSNSAPEIDGLDDLLTVREQAMFDVEVDRERRRAQQGYATVNQSRAFLEAARRLTIDDPAPPAANEIADAYFRDLDDNEQTAPDASTAGPNETSAGDRDQPAEPGESSDDATGDVMSLVELLVDAGVLAGPPRALLAGPDPSVSQNPSMQGAMEFLRDHEPEAFIRRTHELAFLSNILVAGCPLQDRVFTLQEASDAAVAICNLGLENWPLHWTRDVAADRPVVPNTSLPVDFLARQSLVPVCQVGWHTLYERVCLYTAERLIGLLSEMTRGVSSGSRRRTSLADPDTLAGIEALCAVLRKGVAAGTPWSGRETLDVIMTLDIPAWATIVGLIAEYPVIHGAMAAASGVHVKAVKPSDFTFISRNPQIAAIYAYLDGLPAMLGGLPDPRIRQGG
jgi:hypothetical protein